MAVLTLAAGGLASMTGCAQVVEATYEVGTPVKVGLICLHDDSSTYDANFINALKDAAKELGSDKVIFEDASLLTGINEDQQCFNAAKKLVKQGCNLIFADSFGHQDFMKQAAAKWKGVQFCHATGTNAKTANLSNYHNAFASIYEGRYLAGVAAGLKLGLDYEAELATSGDGIKVGYVGAFPYAEVKSGYTSWFLGVRAGVESLGGDPQKVTMDVRFTNDWYTPTGESSAADELIAGGAKLISQHADSMGAPLKCAEKNIPNVSYNIETKDVSESCKNSYLAYSRINWAPYYEAVINAVYAGRPIEGETSQNWTGTIATNSVEYNVEWDNVVAGVTQDKEAKLATVKEQFENIEKSMGTESFHVYNTKNFTVSADTVAAIKKAGGTIEVDGEGHVTSYLADTDGDFVGEQEVIKALGDAGDHYFAESEYCSAPYFDLDIEGINLPRN